MNEEMRINLNDAYRRIAETYLARKYGVDRLDERFAECEPAFIPAEWREGIWPVGMKYISLLNQAHTERLSAEDEEQLTAILASGENKDAIIDIISGTYKDVLAGNLQEGSHTEYFPDIHDRGTFPARAIVFMFSDEPEYDSEGNRIFDNDEKKSAIFENVKAQFEEIARESGDDEVYLIRY